MRMQFYHCLIVVMLPYFVTAFIVDLCQIGASTGMAVGCIAASTVAGTIPCAIGAAFTFGISCFAGIATKIAIEGGCVGGKAILSKGKEIYRFYRYLVKLNYFDYLRGHSHTTLTSIWLFLTTYLPSFTASAL